VSYSEYLRAKMLRDPATGMRDVSGLPSALFPFQADIVRWALRRGRAAIFAGTGLGKTLMELAWAEKVSAYLGKPVLILTPLAVAPQFIDEAAKFNLQCQRANGQSDIAQTGVFVTNYEKLDRFDLMECRADPTAAERQARYRARKKLSDTEWYSLREAVFERDGYACTYCGATEDLACDHVIPLIQGGTNDMENLTTACRSCNCEKSGRTPEEWLAE